jgi:hypothetical protein
MAERNSNRCRDSVPLQCTRGVLELDVDASVPGAALMAAPTPAVNSKFKSRSRVRFGLHPSQKILEQHLTVGLGELVGGAGR